MNQSAPLSLIPFNNDDFGQIRALLIDNEPWFVGKDVAHALGYKRERDALKEHVDEDDKLRRQITASGQRREFVFINESGLYSLIFGSKLPSAKKFKRWVTSVVLPSIRKTGSFSLNRDSRWLETRQLGKKSRNLLTHAIKALYDYFNARSIFYPDGFLFGHLTNLVQNLIGIPKGGRDSLSVKKLNQADQTEELCHNIIFFGIANNSFKSLADVDAQILLQLKQLNNLLCGQLFLPDSQEVSL